MGINQAIKDRHSVRSYQTKALPKETVEKLSQEIEICNHEGGLHIQLVTNEPKAFQSRLAKYGKFCNVNNYLIMAARVSDKAAENIGYYGEKLVLLAQCLGLNSCWVGLTYSKVPGAFTLNDGEKVYCCIALGYGDTQGISHPTKSTPQVSNVSEQTPDWFRRGVEAALLAPTAINQQKFFFEWMAPDKVRAERKFSFVGYTKIDLGIAKYHFEVAAGKENFVWA